MTAMIMLSCCIPQHAEATTFRRSGFLYELRGSASQLGLLDMLFTGIVLGFIHTHRERRTGVSE